MPHFDRTHKNNLSVTLEWMTVLLTFLMALYLFHLILLLDTG